MAKRTVEVFSAGCSAREETINLVNSTACTCFEVTVLDMKDPKVVVFQAQCGRRAALRPFRIELSGE